MLITFEERILGFTDLFSQTNWNIILLFLKAGGFNELFDSINVWARKTGAASKVDYFVSCGIFTLFFVYIYALCLLW